MDREKMIQELIQKRINSNNQIKKDMEYISLYKKKKERLDTYNKHQNSLMEKVQTLSEQIEKQKEAKKESELKAYEEALEKLSIEKERYERIKAEQENKLKAFEETMNQKYEILYNKWQNYYGEDKKVDRKLKKEYEKFYHLSDKKIDELREKYNGQIIVNYNFGKQPNFVHRCPAGDKFIYINNFKYLQLSEYLKRITKW